MNTTAHSSRAPHLAPSLRAATVAGLAFAAFVSAARGQAVVDPDPEIFDGTKTKREAIQQEAKSTVDDWEGPNLIIYDQNGQSPDGQGSGGTGMTEGTAPGLDIGIAGGGGLPGIPNPLAGGMGGGTPDPSLQIPQTQQGGGSESQQKADTTGAAQSAARPSDVSIGDASQQIKTTAQGQAGNTPGKPEGGEQGAKEAGEDSTNIPSSANVNQSGNRGGGVEKGDAMPPDQI
jgi:hypothetical protein